MLLMNRMSPHIAVTRCTGQSWFRKAAACWPLATTQLVLRKNSDALRSDLLLAAVLIKQHLRDMIQLSSQVDGSPSFCLLLTGTCVRCHWWASPMAKLAKLSATRKPHGMSRNGHGYSSPGRCAERKLRSGLLRSSRLPEKFGSATRRSECRLGV